MLVSAVPPQADSSMMFSVSFRSFGQVRGRELDALSGWFSNCNAHSAASPGKKQVGKANSKAPPRAPPPDGLKQKHGGGTAAHRVTSPPGGGEEPLPQVRSR